MKTIPARLVYRKRGHLGDSLIQVAEGPSRNAPGFGGWINFVRFRIPPSAVDKLFCRDYWPDDFIRDRSVFFPIPYLTVNGRAFAPALKRESESAAHEFFWQQFHWRLHSAPFFPSFSSTKGQLSGYVSKSIKTFLTSPFVISAKTG